MDRKSVSSGKQISNLDAVESSLKETCRQAHFGVAWVAANGDVMPISSSSDSLFAGFHLVLSEAWQRAREGEPVVRRLLVWGWFATPRVLDLNLASPLTAIFRASIGKRTWQSRIRSNEWFVAAVPVFSAEQLDNVSTSLARLGVLSPISPPPDGSSEERVVRRLADEPARLLQLHRLALSRGAAPKTIAHILEVAGRQLLEASGLAAEELESLRFDSRIVELVERRLAIFGDEFHSIIADMTAQFVAAQGAKPRSVFAQTYERLQKPLALLRGINGEILYHILAAAFHHAPSQVGEAQAEVRRRLTSLLRAMQGQALETYDDNRAAVRCLNEMLRFFKFHLANPENPRQSLYLSVVKGGRSKHGRFNANIRDESGLRSVWKKNRLPDKLRLKSVGSP